MHHIFGYLKNNHNTEMMFGPSTPDADMSNFEHQDWTSSEFGHLFEWDKEPDKPSNLPTLRGIGFSIRGKLDADRVEEIVTRRSRKAFTFYLNSSPVHWLSKKQNNVESSYFGSDFTEMKQSCENL